MLVRVGLEHRAAVHARYRPAPLGGEGERRRAPGGNQGGERPLLPGPAAHGRPLHDPQGGQGPVQRLGQMVLGEGLKQGLLDSKVLPGRGLPDDLHLTFRRSEDETEKLRR